MNEKKQRILELLAPFYYMATLRDGFPRMRPMGFVRLYRGQLYFGMSPQKNLYKEICADPHMEFCNTGKRGTWVRVRGIAVRETDPPAISELMDSLNKNLPKEPTEDQDADFVLFYLDQCIGEIYTGDNPVPEIVDFSLS